MSVKKTCTNKLAFAASLSLLLAWAGYSQANPVVYNIDSTQSYLSVGPGSLILGKPLSPQAPGGDIDYFTGTIAADEVGGLGGVLTFSGGSSIEGLPNPAGPFSPATPAATIADNFGVTTVVNTSLGFPGVEALRDLIFDITTGTAVNGNVPSGETLLITSGFGTIVNIGSGSFVGGTSPNTTALPASITSNGLLETLVLPIFRVSGTSTHFELAGQVVATRLVPEPSTIALAGMGAVGLAWAAWRKRRK